ncbi:hypothetical protein ACI65C_004413 [Semiaphis heraclei]
MNCGNDTDNMFANYVSDDNMENIDNSEYTELQNVVNSIFTTSPCKTSLVNQPVNGFVLEPSYDETIYLSLKEKSEVNDHLEEWKMGDLANKCPKGKLYSKYFNKIRSLRSHGLVSQLPKDNKSVEKQTRVCAELDGEITVENDAEVATLLSSLKHEDLSWPDIEIDIDFKRLYGKNLSDLLTTFDASYNKLIQIYGDRIKDVNSKKLLEELKNDINASESMY